MKEYNVYDVFDMILNLLPESKEDSFCGYWTDGEKIFCNSLEDAETIADLLDSMSIPSGYDGFNTTEWSYEEDSEDSSVDDYSGCSAIYYGEL